MLASAGYGALCLWFFVHQHEFQFGDQRGPRVSPQSVGLTGFAAVDIMTEDGERLDAWWSPLRSPARDRLVPPRHAGESGRHGVAPARSAEKRAWRHGDRLPRLWRLDRDPSEVGLRLDARAAFDWIRGAAPGSKIAVFGESLGTGPAVALARDRPVAGVLLNSPYASVRRLFELKALPLPYRWLMRDQFDSEALIAGSARP